MASLKLEMLDSNKKKAVVPKEPLYTLLATSNPESVRYLLNSLNDFEDEAQLDDLYPEVGLTRREFLEQVYLVVGSV